MNETADLHRQAMSLADQADQANRNGDGQTAQHLFRQAFDLERRAAERMISHNDAEPTRSVLLRSAASLAIGCHEYREAERLIATALAGNPPREICEELRDLLEELYTQSPFRRAEK
jgi:hypothetical protein